MRLDRRGHDLARHTTPAADELPLLVPGEPGEPVEHPPPAAPVRLLADEVGLADQPDQAALVVEHGNGTDLVLEHQVDDVPERRGGRDGDDPAGHHITDSQRAHADLLVDNPMVTRRTALRYGRSAVGGGTLDPGDGPVRERRPVDRHDDPGT